MSQVVFDHVTKYFGENKAVNDAHFSINEGEFLPCWDRAAVGKPLFSERLPASINKRKGISTLAAESLMTCLPMSAISGWYFRITRSSPFECV